MKLGSAVCAAILACTSSSFSLDGTSQPSPAKLEAAVKTAEANVGKRFVAAAALREAGKIVDPDPEAVEAIITSPENNKEKAQAYIEAKSNYLLAKAEHAKAKAALEEAKQTGKARP